MEQIRPGQANTLPRNFMFHPSNDFPESTPQTPKPLVQESIDVPPPPPQPATYGPRRRINLYKHTEIPWLTDPSSPLRSPDIPLPTIELFPEPQSTSSRRWNYQPPSTPSNRLRVPSYRLLPPKTPPAQIQDPTENTDQNAWAFVRNEAGRNIQRPLSACSHLSDSSISSRGSLVSGPSFGGSCTSPESDFQDPFMPSERKSYLETPSKPSKTRHIIGKKLNMEPTIRWSVDMDNHLWSTYQRYLQDPTITPFKLVPGTIPPLGVCHRVAREAKRTWSRARKSPAAPAVTRNTLRHVHGDVSSASKSLTPTALDGETTPTLHPNSRPSWPRSESAARKRFKELCKRKFSIAPHYQRLLQSRSPSPFLESTQTSRASSRAPADSLPNISFSTRDLGISLVASSVNEPLAQLATSPMQQTPSSVDDWFGRPMSKTPEPRRPVPTIPEVIPEVAEQPTQTGLPELPPRLGSPFVYHTWGPENSRRVFRPKTPLNQCDTIHITGSRVLASNRNDPFSNMHKRRAQHQLDAELSPGGNLQRDLEQIFQKGSGDVSQRRVRIRNRGVTLGAADTQERFNSLFTQPPPLPQSESQPILSTTTNSSSLDVPFTETKRLGSPFDFTRTRVPKSSNNVFRHGPSLSDPFVCTKFTKSRNERPPLGETLRTFGSFGAEPVSSSSFEGPSEAEKMAPAILRTPFS